MTITRTLVNGGLLAARLPLTVAEVTLRRSDRPDAWAPSVAFETFEATVKQVVGSLTHDEGLLDDGRLIRAKVGQLRKSAEFETLAEFRQDEADAEFAARREADAEKRRKVDERTAIRKRAADENRREEERQTAERLERRAASAAEAAEAADVAAAKRERAARAKELRAERNAVENEKRANAAKARVDTIGTQLSASKAARRSAR